MSKYIKLFETHDEYTSYIEDNVLKPNVSYCEDNNEVHYNPILEKHKYLTFEVLETGNVSFTYDMYSNKSINEYLEYSLDNGKTWSRITNANGISVTKNISVNTGDKILWKGLNRRMYENYDGNESFSGFYSNCEVNIRGNIMSFIYSDDFMLHDDFQLSDTINLEGLFGSNNKSSYLQVVNSNNLILPATTLASSCYNSMFNGCTSLITAPALPATTLASSCYNSMFNGCTSLTIAPALPATILANYCYSNMFYGCTKLNYIKAMFITTPSSAYTSNWVKNVAATGTFVKNSTATWNVTGNNGIPSGWTVQTAST